MFKFEIGDRVKKIKGYKFIGRVVARYKVENGIRYDVQVNGSDMINDLHALVKGKNIVNTVRDLDALVDLVTNCDGMIHIFAEDQIEKV